MPEFDEREEIRLGWLEEARWREGLSDGRFGPEGDGACCPAVRVQSSAMRHLLLVLALAVSLLGGFYFRGDADHTVSLPAVIVLSVCVLAADLLGPPRSRPARMGAALLAGVLFAVGWYLGGRELDAAIDDCAHRAEAVRTALAEHRQRTGSFPASRDELAGFEWPGRRLLRGSPLQYMRTDDGYVLSYRDGRLTFTATHEHELSVERGYE